ncbi:MAG: endopeptidase La [Candidatus Omnitrophica bacterium]|nr:endopeptidase La [Candidatus Omnitrophota bacterium]
MFKETLPLLPLRDIVIFPHMVVPLLVGREKSIKALDGAMSNDKVILLCTQKHLKQDEPGTDDIYHIGTVANILQMLKLPEGSFKILIEGVRRVKIKRFLHNKDFYKVQIEPIGRQIKKTVELEALMRAVMNQFEEYVKLSTRIAPEVLGSLAGIDNVQEFADMVASHLILKVSDKQRLLEMTDPEKRLKCIGELLGAELEILKIEKRIMGDIKKGIEKSQKDFYLQEQLKAIEKELGQKDSHKSEIGELRQSIFKARMTSEAQEIALRELNKFSKMLPVSPEATVIRNYIDWLVNLPWSNKTEDNLDIENAKKVLEEDHYGLEKPKERILEYLAVRKLSNSMKGPILCFVGPPGVGKTSLAKSIARALGRNFVRVSLGGIRDEAEIRGHRRTYIGALPGRIIQSMRKAKSKNPVFLLDEVDKMSVDFRGDPSSALLEVLDPEQNHSFSDHYLEAPFDLSDCLFITTSNIQYNIPPPLIDRMELITLPGYTEYEKLKIATKFLIPKEVKQNGLKEKQIYLQRNAILKVIKLYTREAGVRELQRKIAQVCRKVARQIVKRTGKERFVIMTANLHRYLGVPQYTETKRENSDGVGVAMGLAWTEAGGDIMPVESTLLKGSGKLMLTGKLGEVMQESAQAALSYIRSKTAKLGVTANFYKKKDIHIHVPEGAIPKDGPSAGITIAAAMISSLTGRPLRNDTAMTGEITLRGRILPVGGIKSKVLAAHRTGIKRVVMPKENEKDLTDIPKEIRKSQDIVLVSSMDDVLKVVMRKSNKRMTYGA